jgi:glucosyltransferase GtrII-like protein
LGSTLACFRAWPIARLPPLMTFLARDAIEISPYLFRLRSLKSALAVVAADLFHLQRRLAVAFVSLLLFYLPLIDVRYYFLDDVGRTLVSKGYMDAGRPLAHVLLGAFTLGPPFTDIAPAPQLLGVLALAVAGALLGTLLGMQSAVSIGIFAVALGGSPYFLENMSFRFDSGFMALGVLCAIAPFWLAGRGHSVTIGAGSALLLASLCLYQPTINCYVVIVLYLAAQSLPDKSVRATSAFALRCAVPLFVAVVTYWLLWKTIGAGFVRYLDAQGQFAPLKSALGTAASNLAQFARMVVRDWEATHLALIWGLMALVAVICLANRIAQSSDRSRIEKVGVGALAIAFLALTLPAAFLAQIFLSNPGTAHRTFTGTVMLTAIFTAAAWSGAGLLGRVGRILVVLQVLALVGISYTYANALRTQERYDDRITSAIVHDIQEVAPSGELWSFAISGWTGRSPMTELALAKYPALEALVFSVMYQGSYWATARLRTFGLWMKPASLSEAEKQEIICRSTPRKRNAVYDLYVVDKMAFIRFKNDGVKCL